MRRRLGDQLGAAHLTIADGETGAGALDRLARRAQREEGGAVGAGRHLGLVAAGVERLAGGAGQPRRLAWRRQLAREQGRRERLGRWIGGVVDDEPERSEQVIHPAGEGTRQRHAVDVVAAEAGEQVVGELGGRERLAEGGERGSGGAGRQGQRRDRTRPGAGRGADADRLRRQLGVEHRTLGHLVPVVILGIHPEHRDRRHSVRGFDVARQLDGSERLEQGERRPAEGAGLLAGGDDDGVRIAEPCGRGAGGGGRLPRGLLSREGGGDRGAVAPVRRGAGDRIAPGAGLRRVAGEDVGDLGEGVGDVQVERARPGQARQLDADGGRGRRRRRCGGRRRSLTSAHAPYSRRPFR
jgi:hypothetical protein